MVASMAVPKNIFDKPAPTAYKLSTFGTRSGGNKKPNAMPN